MTDISQVLFLLLHFLFTAVGVKRDYNRLLLYYYYYSLA